MKFIKYKENKEGLIKEVDKKKSRIFAYFRVRSIKLLKPNNVIKVLKKI
jgi:hypothetical protein